MGPTCQANLPSSSLFLSLPVASISRRWVALDLPSARNHGRLPAQGHRTPEPGRRRPSLPRPPPFDPPNARGAVAAICSSGPPTPKPGRRRRPSRVDPPLFAPLARAVGAVRSSRSPGLAAAADRVCSVVGSSISIVGRERKRPGPGEAAAFSRCRCLCPPTACPISKPSPQTWHGWLVAGCRRRRRRRCHHVLCSSLLLGRRRRGEHPEREAVDGLVAATSRAALPSAAPRRPRLRTRRCWSTR
jgi:hypothetical protein